MDKRLDEVDKRLDGMDKRLDGMDKRLDGMDKRLDGMDKRLDGMDTLIEKLVVGQRKFNREVNARFDTVEESIAFTRRVVIRIENDLAGKLRAVTDGQVVLEENDQDHEQRIISLEDIAERHSAELIGLR
jgi:archaellum component FlaC